MLIGKLKRHERDQLQKDAGTIKRSRRQWTVVSQIGGHRKLQIIVRSIGEYVVVHYLKSPYSTLSNRRSPSFDNEWRKQAMLPLQQSGDLFLEGPVAHGFLIIILRLEFAIKRLALTFHLEVVRGLLIGDEDLL